MDVTAFRARLGHGGVILVVRLDSPAALDAVAATAAASGIDLLEVTSNTPGALQWVEANAGLHPGLDVGVGTVIDRETATAAVAAGATFLVAPNVDPDILELAAELDVACMPGALTATEVLTAHRLGAAATKLFPTTQLGPGYVSDLLGPLPEVPLVPIGGIDEFNAAAYITAGASAVGVGAAFVNSASVAIGDWRTLGDRLSALVQAVADARHHPKADS